MLLSDYIRETEVNLESNYVFDKIDKRKSEESCSFPDYVKKILEKNEMELWFYILFGGKIELPQNVEIERTVDSSFD